MPPYLGTRGESVTIDPGDVQIGAVEVKDGGSDNRGSVDAAGALLARIKTGEVIGLDAATLAALETITAAISGTVEVTNDSGTPLPVTPAAAAGAVAHTADNTVTTDESILAANANRKAFVIQNTGAVDARLRLDGGVATATLGVQLVAGATLILSQPECGVAAVHAISETGVATTFAVAEVVNAA